MAIKSMPSPRSIQGWPLESILKRLETAFYGSIQLNRSHLYATTGFIHDRELLECTCGLIEDVAFDGSLFTYHKNDHALKDTGLRFTKVNEDTFCCPVCKAKLKAEYL